MSNESPKKKVIRFAKTIGQKVTSVRVPRSTRRQAVLATTDGETSNFADHHQTVAASDAGTAGTSTLVPASADRHQTVAAPDSGTSILVSADHHQTITASDAGTSILVPTDHYQRVAASDAGTAGRSSSVPADHHQTIVATTCAGISNLAPAIESCELRIRTLSAMLRNMGQADSPTSTREEVPAFLHHIATLLTRGTAKDKEAKHVVAVTATVEESSMNMLIVVENSPSARQNVSEDFKLDITTVKRNPQTLKELYDSIGTPRTIKEYIADLLGFLHSVDPHNQEDVTKFRTFVTMSCITKLQSRLKSKWWRSPLSDTLISWRSVVGDEVVDRFWVTKPKWKLRFDIEENMTTRAVNGNTEWEFSIDTAYIWSTILGSMLETINNKIAEYRSHPPKSRETPLRRLKTLVLEITYLYGALYHFMANYECVVKALLAIPSLVSSFIKKPSDSITPPQGEDDEEDEVGLLPEPNESPADSVYRYLEGVVAWAVALHQLLKPGHIKRFTTISVGVVLVTGSRSDVMSIDEVISGLLEKYPSSKDFIQTNKLYLESMVPSYFHGAIHAEATLMGLISYFSLGGRESNRRALELSNPDTFEEIIRPALINPAIAISKKCCWCCAKLSQLINPAISIPGSHGTIYPWCPPRIGIDLDVLEALEAVLWTRLYQGLKMKKQTHSRQSSGSSSFDDSDSEINIWNESETGYYMMSR